MKASKPAKKHHYLPKFYLKQFADSSGMVLRTFLDQHGTLREDRCRPRSTGYEVDLYSMEKEAVFFSEPRKDAIEVDVLSPIDSNAAGAVRRIVDHADITHQDRIYLALFINSLLERHPQQLHERDEQMEDLARKRVPEFVNAGATPESRQRRRDAIEGIDIGAMGRNQIRGAMAHEIKRPDVIEYLKACKWLSIHLDSTADFQLVTGDKPVVVNAGDPWPIHFLSLALGPADMLFVYKSEEIIDDETIGMVIQAHNLTLFRQVEYVYSRDRLADGLAIRTRRAAETTLKRVPWRRS